MSVVQVSSTPVAVQNSLPVYGKTPYPSLSYSGLFAPVQNIVGFNTPTNAPGSGSVFVNLIKDTAQIVGSTTAPYMPISLSSYIPTIYQNLQSINSNLVNSISSNDLSRNYPTSVAVQEYVQSQLNGSEILTKACVVSTANATTSSDCVAISTSLTTSVIKLDETVNSYPQSSGTDIYSLFMIPVSSAQNNPRNGASKTVVCNSSFDISNTIIYIDLGPKDRFISEGKSYQYYQFTYKGDFISYIQAYNSSDTGHWEFFVTAHQSAFSNGREYTVSGSTYNYFSVSTSSELPIIAPVYNF